MLTTDYAVFIFFNHNIYINSWQSNLFSDSSCYTPKNDTPLVNILLNISWINIISSGGMFSPFSMGILVFY